MIEFISTLYNEEEEIIDLLLHVSPYVDKINLIDDGSTDTTLARIGYFKVFHKEATHKTVAKTIEHTGLCEIGRIRALEMCDDDSWIIMLDADERFAPGVLEKIVEFCNNPPEGVTHLYFSQREFIDNSPVAAFAKVKVFKKSAAHLPEIIHRDPSFDGTGVGYDWVVIHRKTVSKQVMRELQYLDTYDKLLDEGKVTQDDVNWFKGMHHYVRDRHG